MNDLHQWIKRIIEWDSDHLAALAIIVTVEALLALRIAFWWTRDLREKKGQLKQENQELEEALEEKEQIIEERNQNVEKLSSLIKERDESIRKLNERVKVLEAENADLRRRLGEDRPPPPPLPPPPPPPPPVAQPRCWVIAPHSSTPADRYLEALKFDLAEGVISIGWGDLGDIVSFPDKGALRDRAALRDALRQRYPMEYPADNNNAVAPAVSSIWNFCRSIKPGDVIVARQGTRRVARIACARSAAFYKPGWSPARESYPDGTQFSYHIKVEWLDLPRGIHLDKPLGMHTVYEIPEAGYRSLFGEPPRCNLAHQ